MSVIATDIAMADPFLVLTVESPSSVRCVGTLDGMTGHHLVDTVDEMLAAQPDTIAIDIERLRLADRDAAEALNEVQHRAKQAGTTVRWHGVGADHLRTAPHLAYRTSLKAA